MGLVGSVLAILVVGFILTKVWGMAWFRSFRAAVRTRWERKTQSLASKPGLGPSIGLFVLKCTEHAWFFATLVLLEFFHLLHIYIRPKVPEGLHPYIDAYPTLLPYVIVAVLLIAAFIAYHELRQEKLSVESRLSPKLAILFGPGSPFEYTWRTGSGEGAVDFRLFRIGVKNLGNETIDRVQVDLEAIKVFRDPEDINVVAILVPMASFSRSLPVPLHVMHDNPPPGQPFQRQFSLDSDEVQYIDVVQKATPFNLIKVCHIVPGVPGSLFSGAYVLTILAHGRNVQSYRKNFVVDADDEGRLLFRAHL